MLRKILILMIAVALGALSSVPSFAGGEDAALPVAPPSAEGTASDGASPVVPDAGGYLIGPGDVLDISVWKDEALTRSCVVRPDGAISFPLIGDVTAAGMTVSRLKAEMERKLNRYVPRATLSLEVKQVNSMVIYVIGKVNAPGRYVMSANVEVLQALATAGGLNIYAKQNKIKIFRQEKEETIIYPFEYDEVTGGRRLEQNIVLKRGDVVVVP